MGEQLIKAVHDTASPLHNERKRRAPAQNVWYRDTTEAQQTLQSKMIAVLLKARDVEAQREARRNDCDARNISAIDIAKVVSACAYHGDVERGMQWWAGTRVIL